MKKWMLIGLVGLCCGVASAEEICVELTPSEGLLTATGIVPGSTCTVEWASTLLNGFTNVSPNFEELVVDDNGTVQVAVPMFFRVRGTPRMYLVIDLSGGTNAMSYPVSNLSSLPDPVPDEYKTTKLVLRHIPAGTFTMGSPSSELGRLGDETEHSVTLTEGFYMGVFELTQKQWELVMGSKPALYKSGRYPVEQVSYDDIRGSTTGAGWPADGDVDDTSFMGKLRQRTGLTRLDLPTEAQWEYACRAGTIRAYNDQTKNSGEGSDCLTTFSGTDANLEPLAVYGANDPGHEANVGTKQANAWGLYDMHGNVYEWCLDWHGSYGGLETNPAGASSGSYRVFRGGYWRSAARFCRSASRDGNTPDYLSKNFGFRVCFAP